MVAQYVNKTTGGKSILMLAMVTLFMTGIGMVQQGYEDMDYMTIVIGLLVIVVGAFLYMFKSGYFGPKPEPISLPEEDSKEKETESSKVN